MIDELLRILIENFEVDHPFPHYTRFPITHVNHWVIIEVTKVIDPLPGVDPLLGKVR